MAIKRIFRPFRSPVVTVMTLSLLIVATIGVRARVWRNSVPATSNGQQPRSTHGPVEVVYFTLYDVGIYPREVKVRAGLIALAIEDLSGGTAGLALTRVVNGQPLRVGLVGRFPNHWRGRSEIRLEAGQYEVFDSSRPNNRATLVVEP